MGGIRYHGGCDSHPPFSPDFFSTLYGPVKLERSVRAWRRKGHPRFAPPPLPNQSRRSKPSDLDVCPTLNHSLIGFVTQPINRSLLDFEPKPRNCRGDFEAKITKSELPILRPKPENRRPWFRGSTKKLALLDSICTVQTAHDVTRPSDPLSTGHVLDHLWSSAPYLLLLSRYSSLSTMSHLSPVHHETNNRDSPHETRIKVKLPKCLGFEFKLQHVNDSSHIKPRY
jgi:hypothetical protein